MKIFIIGAGFTGIQLAKRFVDGKNDVVLIDNNKDAVSYAENRLDCGAILADGNNLAVLEEAGIADADALVCVTADDEVNMITCSLVDSVYPKILKIARVRNYAYYVNTAEAAKKHSDDTKNNRPLYGIDFMVNPDFEAAQAIVNSIEKNSIIDSLKFDNSPYEILRITVEEGSPFDGIALKDLWRLTSSKFFVAYMERDGVASLPYGATTVKAGDVLGLLLERSHLAEFLKLCGSKIMNIQKIALVGAGRIGTLIAERLGEKQKGERKFFRRQRAQFVIIESDAERASAAEERFAGIAKVFNADVTEEGFLEEEKINNFDLLICSTSNYEMNIVTAAYVESLGVQNSVVLVASDAYGSIARRLGIEVAVPVRDTVVDSIMSHLRGDTVSGIHSVNGGFLEILEVNVAEGASVDGKKLMEISDPGKFLVLMALKKGAESYRILKGDSVLEAGDKLVIIATKADSQHVLERFSK